MTRPEEWMGVYRRLENVPNRYRLYHHADAYDDRDVYQEFLTNEVLPRVTSDWTKHGAHRQGRRWKEFLAQTSQVHHALATPDDIETWAQTLLDDVAMATARRYWTRIEAFYRWLMWNADYPHVYNPALMAADQDGASSEIWEAEYA